MTDRMSDTQLDREIRSFLSWQAEDIADAPSAAEMAIRIGSHAGSIQARLRPAPRLVWVLIALLVVALLGAAVIGAALLRHDPVRLAYEAVFLRLEVVTDAPQVVAVGVNTKGRERLIARLPSAWVNYAIEDGYLAPMGAVSPTGLLAIPFGSAAAMEWEIFDLHRPKAEATVIAGIRQDVEQLQLTSYFGTGTRPSVFWGPGDRLAIPWYERLAGNEWHLSFVDGRTGAARSVNVPGPSAILPWWASDGSGVFVGTSADPVSQPLLVLRPDGTVGGTAAVAVPNCRTRAQSGAEISVLDGRVVRRVADARSEEVLAPGGVRFACLAPDDSTLVLSMAIGSGGTTAVHPMARLIAQGSGTTFEIKGSFAGWLEVDR